MGLAVVIYARSRGKFLPARVRKSAMSSPGLAYGISGHHAWWTSLRGHYHYQAMITSPLPVPNSELPADCRRWVVKAHYRGVPVPLTDSGLPAPVLGFLAKSWKSKRDAGSRGGSGREIAKTEHKTPVSAPRKAPEQARTQTSKYLLLLYRTNIIHE